MKNSKNFNSGRRRESFIGFSNFINKLPWVARSFASVITTISLIFRKFAKINEFTYIWLWITKIKIVCIKRCFCQSLKLATIHQSWIIWKHFIGRGYTPPFFGCYKRRGTGSWSTCFKKGPKKIRYIYILLLLLLL